MSEDESKNHPLSWSEDKESGRKLQHTPMFSDGILIYAIAQRSKPQKEKIGDSRKYGDKDLYSLESYLVKENKFELVSEVILVSDEKTNDSF